MLGVITKLDYFEASFICILTYFLKAYVQHIQNGNIFFYFIFFLGGRVGLLKFKIFFFGFPDILGG